MVLAKPVKNPFWPFVDEEDLTIHTTVGLAKNFVYRLLGGQQP